MKSRLVLAIVVALAAAQISQASLTGNPSADGWTYQGNWWWVWIWAGTLSNCYVTVCAQ